MSPQYDHLIRREPDQCSADGRRDRNFAFIEIGVTWKDNLDASTLVTIDLIFDPGLHAHDICRHYMIRDHDGALEFGEQGATEILRAALGGEFCNQRC